jgi:hypothetical protein
MGRAAGGYIHRVAYDDDDDWPEPERDPEKLEIARRRIASLADTRRRILRWTYAGLGILLIVVILIATLR